MGATPLAANVLTDRLLRSWLRCRRRAWLDRYGDGEQRLWTAHRTLQLDDQQRNFVALLPRKPCKGLDGCSQGSSGVVGPVLARQGRRLTREHRLALALAGRLLAPLQSAPVPEG